MGAISEKIQGCRKEEIMKKYKVIKPYADKYTGEDRYIGQELELTADRAKELEGYVKEVKKKNGK